MITIIILFCTLIFLILSLYSNKIGYRYSNQFYLILFIVLFVSIGLRGAGVDQDYIPYLTSIHNNYTIFEPTFLFVSFLIRQFSLPTFFLFLFYSFFGVGIKLYVIRKYSIWAAASLLIYFSNFLLLHDLNQIRAGVASALLLLSIPFLAQKKYLKSILIIFTAVLFHFSSIILFSLLLFTNNDLNKTRRICWGILPLCFLLLHVFEFSNLTSIIPIESIRLKLDMYNSLQRNNVEGFAQVNLFNPYFVFKYFIYVILLWGYDFFTTKNSYFPILLKIYGFSLLCFIAISSMIPIAGYRIFDLLGVVEILLFPTLFLIFKTPLEKKSMVIVYVLLLLCISIFYKNLILL